MAGGRLIPMIPAHLSRAPSSTCLKALPTARCGGGEAQPHPSPPSDTVTLGQVWAARPAGGGACHPRSGPEPQQGRAGALRGRVAASRGGGEGGVGSRQGSGLAPSPGGAELWAERGGGQLLTTPWAPGALHRCSQEVLIAPRPSLATREAGEA